MRLCKHNCGRNAAKGRTECNTCKSLHWREKSPILFIWHMLKKSALRRYLEFDLPFYEFSLLVESSGMLQNRGREGHNLTIDRRDGSRGYTIDNIQIITKSENSAKYHNKDCEYANAIYDPCALDDNEDAPF